MAPEDRAAYATGNAPLPPDEIEELADELRAIWRTLSRGAHLTGNTELPQRQQFWVLGVLEGGPKRMSDIAEWAHTSQASLTGIIDRLEERGLVERIRSDVDRRVVHVGLTEAGHAEVRCAKAQKVDRLGGMLEPLDGYERQELLRLLRKITDRATGPGTSNPR